MEHDLIQPEYENEYESDGGDFLDELIERGIEYVSGDEEVVDDLGRAEVRALYNEMYRLEVENMRLDHLNFGLKIKCRNYETDQRITTRPVFDRIKSSGEVTTLEELVEKLQSNRPFIDDCLKQSRMQKVVSGSRNTSVEEETVKEDSKGDQSEKQNSQEEKRKTGKGNSKRKKNKG
ncbi:hypothetical protein L6452_00775 [Arctium lappa]|uniref:Uncharacterized protein n=1 Tax=Arctium lappa TaxID=4217 RepID=A0ACB9FFN6_ARCLA|nr:hypothetical protein L6452_00775 [Arctium lappa]